jgi:hypothetical protein
MSEMFPVWQARGFVAESLIEVDHLVGVVDGVLRAGATATIPSVIVTPRRPA